MWRAGSGWYEISTEIEGNLTDIFRYFGIFDGYFRQVYVQPPPPTYEFSCVFCYTSCFQVLDECPTCASGVYPICGWSAVNYIRCNMESDCQYDFQVAMDEAAAVEVITPRGGATPL